MTTEATKTTAGSSPVERHVRPRAWMMVNRRHGLTPILGWEPQAGLHKTWEAVPLYEAGPWTAEECERVTKTLRYLQGIAERGEGRQMRDDETLEAFVLGYVRRLEAVSGPNVEVTGPRRRDHA